MKPLVLYCKSFSTDLRRLVRLAESVQKFNVERLPFYVSVPQVELALFREHLGEFDLQLISDADILEASPLSSIEIASRMPGSLAQQLIKAEFWRLNISEAYLCLDSDAFFIRPFTVADFLAPDGTPYTMLDEAHDLLEDAMRQKYYRIVDSFCSEADLVQKIFGRLGRRYSFGPFPLVWHRRVWLSLHEHYLEPRGMTFADAITEAPIESRWYGEALLAYQAVPLLPCQALFKVYHYAWQFDQDRIRGVGRAELSRLYCGVICQSSWEREMDWPSEGGGWLSRVGRKGRRWLGRT